MTFAGIDPANIVARALPRLAEGLAPLAPPCIFLAAADEPEDGEPLGTEDWLSVVYPFEVAILAAANRDASSRPQLRLWRQQARRAFGNLGRQQVQSDVAGVYDIEPPLNGRLFDRAKLSDQYQFCSFVVRVSAVEAGSN